MNKMFLTVLLLLNLAVISSCVFAPPVGEENAVSEETILKKPTSSRIVIENMKKSLTQLEPDWYERCLHPDYFYEDPTLTDGVDVRYHRDEDVRIIRNLLEDCTAFDMNLIEISSHEEWGAEQEDIPDGAIVSDEHPQQIWEVIEYTIDMDINTKTHGNFRIHQNMKFKLVKDPETGLYSIIRWIDDTPE